MRRSTGPARVIVEEVRGRDSWCCARCGTADQLTTQHRVARGMGGTRVPWINLPANLITLCGSGVHGCHGEVESYPTYAQAHGLSIRHSQDPESMPVFTWRGWVYLLNDGSVVEISDHPGVEGCNCGCGGQSAMVPVSGSR